MSLSRKEMSFDNRPIDVWLFRDAEGRVWLKAKELVAFMGYKDEASAIEDQVYSFNKTVWDDLKPDRSAPSSWHGTAAFITIPGLFQLMMCSKLTDMETFQDWVMTVLLPAVYGTNAIGPSNNSLRVDMLLGMLEDGQRAAQQKDRDIFQLIADHRASLRPAVKQRQNNILAVYYNGFDHDTGRSSFTGIQSKRRNFMRLARAWVEPQARRIFMTDSPHAMNAFERLKEQLLPGFQMPNSNTIVCQETVEMVMIYLTRD